MKQREGELARHPHTVGGVPLAEFVKKPEQVSPFQL
jgi:hypothetical protein